MDMLLCFTNRLSPTTLCVWSEAPVWHAVGRWWRRGWISRAVAAQTATEPAGLPSLTVMCHGDLSINQSIDRSIDESINQSNQTASASQSIHHKCGISVTV